MTEERRARHDETQVRARRLRRAETTPERLIWNLLRNRSLAGLKFRRQYPIGPYVADFYCHKAKLVIEVDGTTHDVRVLYDARRTRFLESQGLQVL